MFAFDAIEYRDLSAILAMGIPKALSNDFGWPPNQSLSQATERLTSQCVKEMSKG